MTQPTDDDVPVLKLEHVSKTFPGTKALRDLSFEVAANEVHAMVGANGSGKSTLVKLLAGYHRADPGCSAWLNGEEFDLESTAKRRHHGLRFVHQDLGLIAQLNVMDNLALSRGYSVGRFRSIDWRSQRRIARALLARFDVSFDVDRPVAEASPTERVIVAIAAALEGWEEGRCLLVLDEPTAVLPPHEAQQLFTLIGELQARGASILYISHRLDEVFTLAHRVTVLRDGEQVATTQTAGLTEGALASLMVGEKADVEYEREIRPASADTVLSARSLRGRYLNGLDIEVRRGEVLGLAGLPESGREEVLYALAGATRDVSGQVRLSASDDWADVKQARKLAIPLVPPDRVREALFAQATVRENLTIKVLDRLRSFGTLSRSRETALTNQWASQLGIPGQKTNDQITTLSGGNQQKVVLARCLATKAPVLLLCEPTAGVDIGARIALYDLIADQVNRGLSVIVTTSDVGDLLALCTRVMVLRRGSCAAELSRQEMTRATLIHAMQSNLDTT